MGRDFRDRWIKAQKNLDAEPGWFVAAGELRIPWRTSLAAHRILLQVNPRGRIVRQFNGLASNLDASRKAWKHKPVGYRRADRLRGYDTRTHSRSWVLVHGSEVSAWSVDRALERGQIVPLLGYGEGWTKVRADRALKPAEEAILRINSLSPGPDGGSGLPYPFLGLGRNSNSVFSTIVRAIGAKEPEFARPVRVAPGERELLLPDHELVSLRDRYAEASTLNA